MRDAMRLVDPGTRDATSFDVCYATYRDEALGVAYLLTGGDRPRAEDAVAEVFCKIYQRWDGAVIHQPRAYVRRAVANEVVSGFRRNARERAYLRQLRSQPYEEDELVLNRAVLDKALASLPPRQRSAVRLRYLEDLSEAEVARRMGTTVGTVKSNAARGLAALRTAMGGTVAASSGTGSRHRVEERVGLAGVRRPAAVAPASTAVHRTAAVA